LYGLIYDPTSLGAVAMLKLGGIVAALVAVLAVLTVVRHTRGEEEAGRLELLGATVVSRYAALTAALLVAFGASLVIGVLTAAGLISAGLPTAGSVAFGLAWAGVGIAFAAVAAVSAQLTQSARSATALSIVVLGFVYLLRAIGDTAGAHGPRWLSWLSPVGWGQQIRPYAGERWWVLLLLAGFAAVLAAGAFGLVARRDLGAGLLPDRPGPASAAAGLRSLFALAWRLHRGAVLGWTAGFTVLGAVLGNIASSVGNLLDSPQAREMVLRLGGEKGLTDAFLAAELGIVGVIASVFGVQAAMRLRAEETASHAEMVLATSVGRFRWAFSHLTVALFGTAALLVGAGLGAGLAHGAQLGDLGQVGPVLLGALVQLPATWVVAAIVVALFGLAPRLIVGGWAALVAFLLIGEFGPLLRLDQWVMDLSPFAHLPKIPGAQFSAAPILWLTVTAAALIAAGLVGLRRRDIG
jgi:ABC-2 type transport system permease protein